MQKYRIYELAKIYNKGNDEIIAVLNKNNIEVKNRLNSVDEKAKEILDKAFASPSVKKNKRPPMRTVRFDQQGRPTGSKTAEVQKKSYSSYNTAVSKPVKTGMPEEAKKAEADKKAEKESLQRKNIINEGKRISKEELNYMHLKKTGELIRSSIVAGAILAEADKSVIDFLNKFGMNLGLAFQIKDDILDVTGDVEKLGKNTLADVNKSNFITMYGLEECKVMCEDLTAECITILDKISVNTDILKELTIELLKRDF